MYENTLDYSRKKGIVFIADHWGKFTGGIDVFNQSLCRAMGYIVEQSKIEVVCLVICKSNDPVESRQVKQSKDTDNIIVHPYVKGENQEYQDACEAAFQELKAQKEEVDFRWFVGHDIHTGSLACRLAKNIGAESAVIFHTDYTKVHQRYHFDRHGEENRRKQDRIACKADYIFCVGPSVYHRMINFLPDKRIYEIIPGLEEQYKRINNPRNIMVAGRFYTGERDQKNWKGACKAIATAMKKLSDDNKDIIDYPVYFIGFEESIRDEELKEIQNTIESDISKETGICPIIHCEKFYSERDVYLEKVSQSRVVVMASEAESFGLTAWEAISMKVPIVISKSSGLYRYLERELGYLMRGLCGSFKAGYNDMNKNMGECIADILLNSHKMQKATEILREEVSHNKWKIVAIDIATYMGMKDVMDKAIFKDSKCYEFTYSTRILMFEDLKRRINNKDIKKRILFFEGVSRELLRDEDFSLSILRLLLMPGREQLNVYLCYGIQEAVEDRAKHMENSNLLELKEKSKNIEAIKNSFEKLYINHNIKKDTKKNFDVISSRIHLIPLYKSPSVYINILDDDWYFTKTFETRTSENPTVKIANETPEGKKEKERIINHMKFILKDTEDNKECQILINEIEHWL